MSLFLARLAVEAGGLDLAQELGEGESAFADRRFRRLVRLGGETLDQFAHAAGVVEEFECGLCAEPTPNDLADAAQVVLNDWDAWSARAHRRAASLEWSSLVQQFEALLSETAAASRDVSLSQQIQGASCESW